MGQKVRLKATQEESFWEPIFADSDFKEFIKKQYQFGVGGATINMEEIANGEL